MTAIYPFFEQHQKRTSSSVLLYQKTHHNPHPKQPLTTVEIVWITPRLSTECFGQPLHHPPDLPLCLYHPLNLSTGIENRRVVAPPKPFPDRRQRGVGELAGEGHGDLPRVRDLFGAALGLH